MMRNTFYKIILFAGLLATLSCNKQLNTVPTQSIDQTAALNTSSDVLVALVGCYADLGVSSLYGGYPFVASELLANAGELNWSGTFGQFTQINNKAITVDNTFVYNTWLAGYAAINDVNNVLSALAVVDSAKRGQVEGEAKFIRGAAYFDLVRLYAKSWNDGDPAANDGVPIVLTPTRGITADSKVKRNKVAEVYTQLLKDLTDAEARLPAKNTFFAGKVSASAMLARVYLQKGDYANAAQAANRAITTGVVNGFTMRPAYSDAFPTNSSANTTEDVFAMQVTTSSGVNSFQTFFSASGRGDIQIKPVHTALYETGDARLGLFYTSGGSVFTGKFNYLYGNVHIIRLAEMYLVRAEANFRAGTAVGDTPLNDINAIRTRVKLPALTAPQLTLAAILKERKLELAFEGFAIHDIKRTQGSVGAMAWNSPLLIYPIPSVDRVANPNLTQNTGY
jgi:hypothetical protein